MDFNDSKRAGGMPPGNPLPDNRFQDNPPPYSTIQNPPTAPMNYPMPEPMSVPMGPMISPAPPVINPNTTYVPVMVQQQMGPNPASVVCHACNKQMITRIETKAAMKTHLFALILCLVGCWPCACVPYCMDSCMNTEHYCSNCNAYIGAYSS